jgi:hypothetical protein
VVTGVHRSVGNLGVAPRTFDLILNSLPSSSGLVASLQAAGELQPRRGGFGSVLSRDAHPVVQGWVRDGGYDAAVAQVVADDPDLADQ